MSEDYRQPRRPPPETEVDRHSSQVPEWPDDPAEAGDAEPDSGSPDDFSGFISHDEEPAREKPAGGRGPVRDQAPGRSTGEAAPDRSAEDWDDDPQAAGGLDTRYDISAWYSDGSDRQNEHQPGLDPPPAVIPRYRGDTGGRRTPYRQAPQPPEPMNTVTIGLWGAPGSGKTAYLAALPQALNSTDGSIGKWAIFPNNQVSEEVLIDWSHQLISLRTFPDLTLPGDVTKLAWRFVGDLADSRYARRGKLRRRTAAESWFDLDLIDVSGEAFGHNPGERNVSEDIADAALDHLARAKGLIYLFDPITERDRQIAAQYMNRTLMRLARRVKDEGRLIGPYLPHYIAVCVTKFDDKDVFRQAREAGLVNYGPDGMPRVLDRQAEALFDAICEGAFWPGQRTDMHGGARWVRNQLRQFFRPDRIRYYAISSIGYKKPLGWAREAVRPGFRFDPDDFSNVIVQDGRLKILGPVEPVNVLEPLVDLHMQIDGWA
jgi:hypothetical protein